MRSDAWLRIVAIISLILWWAFRGKFAIVVLGGGYFVLWVNVGLLLHTNGVFSAKPEPAPRWMSMFRRCMVWASMGAIPGFFLGYASHNFEEKRARAFVETAESRLWEYLQVNGRFPETIESMGLTRPRVDLKRLAYFSDGSDFTFRYPNSFSLFGDDWEYHGGSWSDS